MTIAFTKVALPYGWLGNMAAYPLQYEGRCWRTAEHLFQALRFVDPALREAIRSSPSPMQAKFIARKYRHALTVEPRSTQDVENMELILRMKLQQHPELQQRLCATGSERIVEDCSGHPGRSGLFWGATYQAGAWVGTNTLGKLWMKLREELSTQSTVRGL